MKFKYYITSLDNGNITGTNDPVIAADLALSEDNFVVDTETGQWLLEDGNRQDIEEVKS